jgi:hypothetical protein
MYLLFSILMLLLIPLLLLLMMMILRLLLILLLMMMMMKHDTEEGKQRSRSQRDHGQNRPGQEQRRIATNQTTMYIGRPGTAIRRKRSLRKYQLEITRK